MKKAIAFILLFAISIGCIALGAYLLSTQMSKDSGLVDDPVGDAVVFAIKGIGFMLLIAYGLCILVSLVKKVYEKIKEAYDYSYRERK